jgi:hypothetical protein
VAGEAVLNTVHKKKKIYKQIYVPVVYMARDVMILMPGQHPFQGPLEGVDPENRDFFGPWA